MEPLIQSCINTVRVLAADAVQKANSGHPGTPMGLTPVGHVLWSETMSYNPKNPEWPNRDRFILSCGHACMLQYSFLYLTGYAIAMDDKGTLATIGRNRAVADIGKLNVTGFFAWVIWMTVHLMFLMGFRNKLVVFINWMYSYFTYERGARILLRRH